MGQTFVKKCPCIFPNHILPARGPVYLSSDDIKALNGCHLEHVDVADDMSGTLIGINLTHETGAAATPGINLGFVTVKGATSLSAATFRSTLKSELITVPVTYGFLTKQGWPVSLSQESTLDLKHLIRDDGSIYIQKLYDKPRIGVKTGKGFAIGFVFVEYLCSLRQARHDIQDQLGHIGGSIYTSYQFIDSNGWPVSLEQETLLMVQDIVKDSVIHVCSEVFSLEDLTNSSDESGAAKALQPGKKKSLAKDAGNILGPPLVRQLTYHSSKDVGRRTSQEVEVENHGKMHQILISYVRAEAAQHALDLKKALTDIGYTVYLDIHEIKTGIDWQDALNYAVSNAEVFVPLVSARYGQTQWTNREVKLADFLGKFIIPVSFLDFWPPRCLAIQFATTQYVQWKADKDIEEVPQPWDSGTGEVDKKEVRQGHGSKVRDVKNWDKKYVRNVAKDIDERFNMRMKNNATLSKKPSIGARLRPTFSVPEAGASSTDTGQAMNDGRQLIVISVHPKQKDFGATVKSWFEADGYETWCSTEMLDDPAVISASQGSEGGKSPTSTISLSQEYETLLLSQISQSSMIGEDGGGAAMQLKRLLFQQKADEATVIIFILSEVFAHSKTCQQQVYYCEQRKRFVPLKSEGFCMPGWMSMLIGTSPFEDARRDGYKELLVARVKRALDPGAGDMSEEINEAKITMAVSLLKKTIPSEGCVYISGSTQFYCEKSEALCRAIGKSLALLDSVTIVTGGFYGVGDSVAKAFVEAREALGKPSNVWHILPTRDDLDRQHQARQNRDRTFQTVPYGMTVFSGDSVRERETIVSRVIDICLLVEGGPGAAHEVEQFAWCDHHVIPVKCTGGAAGGKFNVPDKIFEVPQGVSAEDWLLLDNKMAAPEDISSAVTRIVSGLQTTIRLYKDGAATIRKRKYSSLKKIKRRGQTLPTYRSFIMTE
ncbi:uncharacterized protein LOC135489044 isoform X1 [Lineus longissimus]|uniref:uncharacterized protein LOC135489044 isoform X1 n=1 Tax=Lineus longissimus TaxID=88925 RepID=UPI00315D3138